MNKIFKFMMAAVMMMAMVGFVACKKDDDKKSDDSQQQETYEESTSFEIIHNGQAVAAGATVEHTFTAEELDIIFNSFTKEINSYRGLIFIGKFLSH